MNSTELIREKLTANDIPVSPETAEKLCLYMDLLETWNQKMDLTAVTDPEETADRHFVDSLAILRTPLLKDVSSLIDVGTGAGFPGIPLKIVCPWIRLTLLDALQKRIGFLEEVVKELELTDVICVHGRAEDLAHEETYREVYDAACSRAVASLPALLEYCSGFICPGGMFLAYKGPSLMEELAQAQGAMHTLHMEMVMIHQEISMDNEHLLAVFEKTAETSLQYPRKQSKIKNDPL